MQKANKSDGRDRLKRFLIRAYSRSTFTYLTVGVLLAIAIIVVGRDIERHISAIELWIAGLGPWSVLIFIGLFVLGSSLLVPETILAIMAGALFGFTRGLAAVVVGSVLAAALQFLVSRHLLRSQIQRTLAPRPALGAIQQAVKRDAFRLQVLLRLTPLNPATISYLLGVAEVRFSTFLFACLALIPNLLLEVTFGHAGLHVAHLAGLSRRTAYLHDVVAIGSFGVCAIVVFFVSKMAHKAVLEATAGKENPETIASRFGGSKDI